MRLFTFDLLGLKSEKGANNDAREEAYGKVVDMVLDCVPRLKRIRIGLPATRFAMPWLKPASR